MATLRILYETKYGQTQKIAERLAEVTRRRGHRAKVSAVAAADVRGLADADAYVVLAPVYFGRHPPATLDFVARNAGILSAKPSAFVSVSGSAGSARTRDREKAQQQAVDFLASTAWRPQLIQTAGGAVAYPRYGFFTRLLMRAVSKREGRSTDTSCIHELTDWTATERLVDELFALLESRPAPMTAPPSL